MLKILKSAVVIGAVGVLAFGATRAVWSDSGQSTGNTFAAGTLDLRLTDDDEAPADNVTITWNGTAMTPGGATVTADLDVQNIGDPAADHVHFGVGNGIVEGDGVGADASDPMDANLEITGLSYDGASILGYLADVNDNGWIDLDDWENTTQAGGFPGIGDHDGSVVPASGTLPLADLDTDHTLSMTVQLNALSTDANQGDTVTTDMTATLHQIDGQ